MKPMQALEILKTAIQEADRIPPCQVSDPDAWFTDEDDGWASYRQAKKLCQSCPVVTECLTYAVVADEPYGVWGGLSPIDRSRLKKRPPSDNAKGPSTKNTRNTNAVSV